MSDELLRSRLLALIAEHGTTEPVLESILTTQSEASPVRVRYELELLEDQGFLIRTGSINGDQWTTND